MDPVSSYHTGAKRIEDQVSNEIEIFKVRSQKSRWKISSYPKSLSVFSIYIHLDTESFDKTRLFLYFGNLKFRAPLHFPNP